MSSFVERMLSESTEKALRTRERKNGEVEEYFNELRLRF
jgi:hypothetical protein